MGGSIVAYSYVSRHLSDKAASVDMLDVIKLYILQA